MPAKISGPSGGTGAPSAGETGQQKCDSAATRILQDYFSAQAMWMASRQEDGDRGRFRSSSKQTNPTCPNLAQPNVTGWYKEPGLPSREGGNSASLTSVRVMALFRWWWRMCLQASTGGTVNPTSGSVAGGIHLPGLKQWVLNAPIKSGPRQCLGITQIYSSDIRCVTVSVHPRKPPTPLLTGDQRH